MGREVKSHHSFTLFFLLPLPFLFSLLSNMCVIALSCHFLVSPDRNLVCCCSAIFAFGGGDSACQRAQVSSLTGSCPYLAQVAPSDRLKVRADLVFIDDNVLFSFFFLSTQWPVIRTRVSEQYEFLQSDFWLLFFFFHFTAETISSSRHN